MRNVIVIVSGLFISLSAFGLSNEKESIEVKKTEVAWKPGTNIESFWLEYANSKGGLSWGKSSSYPEYEKVKEGDTLLIELEQGPCLMEFFHSRWRRANDVRRWDQSINSYGGCPHVFE